MTTAITSPDTTTTPQLSALEQIQLRSAVDADFRAQLLADPRAALADNGLDVPASIGITVSESTSDTFVLALPPAVDLDRELDEDALADASGGVVWFVAGAVLAIGGVFGFFAGQDNRQKLADLKAAHPEAF